MSWQCPAAGTHSAGARHEAANRTYPHPIPPGIHGTAGASLSCSPQGISPGASRCAAEAHSARGWSWAPLNLGQCRAQFNRSAGMPCIEAGGSQWSLTLLSPPPPR